MTNYQADKLILFDWNGAIEDESFTGQNSYRKKALELLRFFKSDIFENYSDNSVFQYWTMHLEESLYLKEDMKTAFSWFHSVTNDFNLFCDYLQFTNKMKELFDQIQCYQPMLDLASDLKKSCQIGVVANLTFFDVDRFHRLCDGCEFDQKYISGQMNTFMPQPEFYQAVEDKCGVDPSHILFIGASQSNLDLAYRRKWKTKLFWEENFEEIEKACRDFLQADDGN